MIYYRCRVQLFIVLQLQVCAGLRIILLLLIIVNFFTFNLTCNIEK